MFLAITSHYILVLNWFHGLPVVFDQTAVTLLLNPAIISEAGVTAGSAAAAAELFSNITQIVPNVPSLCYGAWGKKAQDILTRLPSHLAIQTSDTSLARSNASALLARLVTDSSMYSCVFH